MDFRTNDTPRERRRSEYPVLCAMGRAEDASGLTELGTTRIHSVDLLVAERIAAGKHANFCLALAALSRARDRSSVVPQYLWDSLARDRERMWDTLQYNSERALAVAREVIVAQCAEQGIDPAPVLAALDAEP